MINSHSLALHSVALVSELWPGGVGGWPPTAREISRAGALWYTASARDERVRRSGLVLRGGSWNNNVENAAAPFRNRNNPNNRNDNYGFRLVAVSSSTFFRPFSGGLRL